MAKPKQQYYEGAECTNGDRTIIYRYQLNNRVYYSESGEKKSMHRTNFYKLKMKVKKPLGNMNSAKVKSVMTKEDYKKQNNYFFWNNAKKD